MVGMGLEKNSSIYSIWITYGDGSTGCYGYGSPNNWLKSTSPVNITETEYNHYKLTVENGRMNYKLYNPNNVLMYDETIDLNSNYVDSDVNLVISDFASHYVYFKNVKVKKL